MKKLLNLCFALYTLLLASCGTIGMQPSASSHTSSPSQQQDRSVSEDLSHYFAGYKGGLTKFWLGTSLQISPREQVEILKRMYHYNLPFSRRNIDIVKKIITLDTRNGAKLSGKTGSSAIGPNGIGWFIGYVETEGNIYYFATEIGGPAATGLKAQAITLNILYDKKIFG